MRERIERMHRRASDSDEPKPHRHHRTNGMTKWVTAAFLSGMIAVLGFLAVADRARIEKDAHDAMSMAMRNQTEIAVLKTMERRLARIEEKQDEILAIVRN